MSFRFVTGIYYGYPVCCITFFAKKAFGFDGLTLEQIATLEFKGFVPCPTCAEKIYKGELETRDLIKNRVCKTPYPDCGPTELANQFFMNYTATYHIGDDYKTITCLKCNMTSHNLSDVKYLYCGNCNSFHQPVWMPLEDLSKWEDYQQNPKWNDTPKP